MKEETKLKLKKAAKVAGLVAGFLATFILGMGFGSCSEKKVQQANAEDSSLVNILDNASYVYGDRLWAASDGCTLINESWADSYLVNKNVMPAGRAYVLDISVFNGLWFFGLPDFASNQMRLGNYGYSFSGGYQRDVTSFRQLGDGLYYFELPSDFYDTASGDIGYSYCYFRVSKAASVYLYDSWVWQNGADLVTDIYLPQNFNPMWMYGDNFQNGLFGMLAGNHDGYSYTGALPIVFRSNGNVYDGIYCYFEPIADMKYQNPVNGEIVTASHTETNYHVCTGMYYRHFGATSIHPEIDASSFDLAWSPVLGLDSDGVTYLTPNAEWATEGFRTLSVLAYMDTIPLSARWPSMNALELIKLRASGFVIVGDSSVYNVFDMLTGAFKSFVDVMSIQILPYMTIGLLFFLPLVVGVLIALVELLKK